MRWAVCLGIGMAGMGLVKGAPSLRSLIVDGRNNHDWQSTTDHLRATLEATGRFSVTVSTAPPVRFPSVPGRVSRSEDEPALAEARAHFDGPLAEAKEEARARWDAWRPDFASADVVVLNYNGETWAPAVREDFLAFVNGGGGVVLVHGANNAFRTWPEFNEMIGLGWRPSPIGRAIKIDPESGRTFVAKDADLPNGGNSSHGSKHAFQVAVRAATHPVMRGLPALWMHASDELYHNMRGPAKNLSVLSSAWSDPERRGSGFHEPLTWEVRYGEGRVIVTSMGHLWPGGMERGEQVSLQCVGFQTVFARSCEYVATGEATLPVPKSFPGEEETSVLPPHAVTWRVDEEGGGDAAISMARKKEKDPYCLLTPEEQLATFEIASGFVVELFASEPMVQEPVLTVWDNDGAMYVAEMRSYMQDVAGTGTKSRRNGRVKRLVDTDGDGRADEATVFVDGLNLPRAVLPLSDGWIAIRESDTMDVNAYRDTDGDGVADESKPLYERGPDGRNNPDKSVEHQDSGLMWNLDNHIYITYNSERYRYTTGEWIAEKQPGHWTQWGLTHDDTGDLYWSTNTAPLAEAYLHPRYWDIPRRLAPGQVPRIPVMLPAPYTPDFLQAHSSCLFSDRGGTAPEVRSFTSSCGQSIYRADKFPAEARGDYFFCDPTIHVVRRAEISKEGGMVRLTKEEPQGEEFLRSSDINCRFINSAEGPDGCLYVTDMYRGIIQDAPWLNPQARENIVANGLDRNIQHGRIWRIRHRDFRPRSRDEMPPMSADSTIALLRHLESPSGWWRDAAQKEILLRPDRESVAPHLHAIARFGENALGRLHALWTLEGMKACDLALLRHVVRDRDPRLRRAAIQIGENLLGDADAFDAIARPLAEDPDPVVAKQLILSLGLFPGHPEAVDLIQRAARRHPSALGVPFASTLSLWGKTDLPLVREVDAGTAFDPAVNAVWKNTLGNWNRGIEFPDAMPETERRRITGGENLYFQHCVTCHGADGRGMGVPGTDLMLAPSLVDSARVSGDPDQLTAVFLHGLTGPIAGKTYQAGFMAPAATLGITREDRLSELITYLRFVHGDGSSTVSHEDVKAAKKRRAERTEPWTDEELNALDNAR